ncbi:MAG TPA: hypothetical protein VGM29_04175 [Polyangiaceae bacterium]
MRGRNLLTMACSSALLALSAGCSSGYQPAESPRASLVMDEGAPHVVRDGVDKGGFTFGDGVVNAVQGNRRAEEEARLGRKLIIGGFVLDLTGIALETGGLIYTIDNPQKNGAHGLGLVNGGLSVGLAGTIMILNGQPHLYDALNIYNDRLEDPAWTPRPPTLPLVPPALPPAPPVPPAQSLQAPAVPASEPKPAPSTH